MVLTAVQERGGKVTAWPGGAKFALFLSHDLDQIYDREFFRLLGDVNHLRRVLFAGEPGAPLPCIKRIARSILWPRKTGEDVETILSIEREYGLRSTFFFLEDRVFNRVGGRYKYSDSATKRIARSIERNGCEIAVHGAYHNFSNPEAYRAQTRSFRDAFGRDPSGIRNHCLRHDGPPTWSAQREAGFRYDASFGWNNDVGIREGQVRPFFPLESGGEQRRDFVVLPMTVMDNVLFWGMRLAAPEALALCIKVAEQVKNEGGLLSLNWHNNYFHDDEYKDWQIVYEKFVEWLVEQRPWNATGEEIADWWIGRSTDPPVEGMGEGSGTLPENA